MRNYDSCKRIRVTGGAGVLGSGPCDRLIEQRLEKTFAYFEDLLRSGFDGVAMTPVRS